MTCACFHLHTCLPIGVRNVAHMLPFFLLVSVAVEPDHVPLCAAAASEACGVPQETQSTFRWFDMEVDQNGVMVMSNNLLLEIRERKREGERERCTGRQRSSFSLPCSCLLRHVSHKLHGLWRNTRGGAGPRCGRDSDSLVFPPKVDSRPKSAPLGG